MDPLNRSKSSQAILPCCFVLIWRGRALRGNDNLVLFSVQEFAVGLDLSTLVDGLIASTAWDETVYVWPQGQDPRLV
jgi:hypothetical protein